MISSASDGLEKNRIRLKKEKLDLTNFIDEVITQFKQTDFGQEVTIIYSCKNKHIEVKADKFHLTNLLINILENAVKYCENKPEIEIRITNEKKWYEISILDNGIGIPKDQRRKIFKKFYRIPTGNVHNVKGFGLGLDYVKKIANAHKWRIKVNENQNGGSIFTLIIPISNE